MYDPPRAPRSARLSPLAALVAVALGVPVAACANWPPSTSNTDGTPSTAATATGTTDPPVIVELDMTNSALTAAANDTYTVYGSISYTDDDDVVTGFQVYVPVVGHTYQFSVVGTPVSSAYGQPISFPLSADPPLGGAGETTYELSLVNGSGAVSQPSIQHADLE
jgi:hypothetical protein